MADGRGPSFHEGNFEYQIRSRGPNLAGNGALAMKKATIMKSPIKDNSFPGNGGPAGAVVAEPGQLPRERQAWTDRQHVTDCVQSTVSCTSHVKQVAVGLRDTAEDRSHQEDNPVHKNPRCKVNASLVLTSPIGGIPAIQDQKKLRRKERD